MIMAVGAIQCAAKDLNINTVADLLFFTPVATSYKPKGWY